MPAAWKTYAGLAAPECVVCCVGCVAVFSLQNYGGPADPYADATEAAAALTSQVVACLVAVPDGESIANLTAGFTTGELTVTNSMDLVDASRSYAKFSACLTAGTLTFDYTGTFDSSASSHASIQLFEMDGTLVESESSGILEGAVGTATITLTVPAEGNYLIELFGGEVPHEGSPTTFATEFVLSGAGLALGAIVADWDDGVDTGTVICS